MKRFLSLTLSIIMIISTFVCVDFSAFADDENLLVLNATQTISVDTETNKTLDFYFTPEEDGYYEIYASSDTVNAVYLYVQEEGSLKMYTLYTSQAYAESNRIKSILLTKDVKYKFTFSNTFSNGYTGSVDIELRNHTHELKETRYEPNCTRSGYTYQSCNLTYCDYQTEKVILEQTNEHNYEYGSCTLCLKKNPEYTDFKEQTVTLGEKATISAESLEPVFFYFTPDEDGYYNYSASNYAILDMYMYLDTNNSENYTTLKSDDGVLYLQAGNVYTFRINHNKYSSGDIYFLITKHTHSISVKSKVVATCQKDGIINYACDDCDYAYSETITCDPNVHQWVNGTCKTCGLVDESYEIVVTEIEDNKDYSFTSVYGGENEYYTYTVPEDGLYDFLFDDNSLVSKIKITDQNGKSYVNLSGYISGTSYYLEFKTLKLSKDDVISIVITGCQNKSYTFSFGKHIHDFDVYTKNATCNSIGFTLHECTNTTCNYSYKDELVEATGNHNFVTATEKPTCTSSGYTTAYCSTCYTSYDYDYVAPNPNSHHYTAGVCDYCGAKSSSFSETTMTLDTTVQAATTTKKGAYLSFTPEESGYYIFMSSSSSYDPYAILYDNDMNYLDFEDDISGSNYNFKMIYYLQANQKYYLYVDTYESKNVNFPVSVTKHTHSFSKQTKAATCGSKGYTRYKCSCGECYYDTVTPVTNKHNWKTDEVVEPNCVEDGYTLQKCSVCGEEQQIDVVKANGIHSFTNGICLNCGELEIATSSYNKVINLGSNDISLANSTQEAVLEFTPNEDGTYLLETTGVYDTYGKLCKADGTVIISDDDSGTASNCRVAAELTKGTTYYFIVRTSESSNINIKVIIEEHTHNFVSYIQPASCYSNGVTTYTCKDCLYQYDTDFVPITNEHNYVDGMCSDCGNFDPNYDFAIHNENGDTTVGDGSILCFTPTYSCNYNIKSNSKFEVSGVLLDESFNVINMLDSIVNIADSNNENDFNFTINQNLVAGKKYYLIVSASCSDDFTITTTVNHKYQEKVIDPTCTKKGYTVDYCTECGASVNARDYTDALGHDYVKTTVVKKATTSANGKLTKTCSRCGDKSSTIYYPKSITLSATKYTYDGKAKKPTVTVKDANGKTISSSNYTVSYSTGRKNVGQYSVKITFKGNYYSGTVTKYFTIVPQGTSIKTLRSTKKATINVTLKKQATQTTGYQIQYSTDSKFAKNVTTCTLSKNTTTSKTISKLSAGKKYYVRVRTYKVVSGKKYYSAWSKTSSVTTKK